jgi:putative transposase
VPRYRHFVNSKDPGVPLFITTTVLDFVHAFHRPEVKDAMVLAIARECRLTRAALYGYVVMPHHVHLLIRPPEAMNGPQFMKTFKKESGKSVANLLNAEELRQFDEQRGLNRNTFWQRSFRSIAIESETVFWQKTQYIHLNPVRAGYVEQPEDYRWSSARLVLQASLSSETGLPYGAVVDSLRTGS